MQATRNARVEDLVVTSNIYFNRALKTYHRNQLNSGTPPASIVLRDMMKVYIKNSEAMLFGLINTSRHHHKEKAVKILNLINEAPDKSHPDVMNNVLNILAEMKDTLTAGTFLTMINTFFTLFPVYRDIKAELKAKTTILTDLWKPAIEQWIVSLQSTPEQYVDHNYYDELISAAKLVPNTALADDFADFLLTELKILSQEMQPGLFAGKIYLALANLAMSDTKKALVVKLMLEKLRSKHATEHDISIIGLCSALNSLGVATADKKDVDHNYLYLYASHQLPELAELFADNLPETLRSYMQVLFNTLASVSNYPQQTKSTIVNVLLEEKNIYAFRFGIQALHKWFTQAERYDLARKLANHERIIELAPLFWNELLRTVPENPAQQRYNNEQAKSKETLKKEPSIYTRILTDMQFVLTEKSIAAAEALDIMDSLTKTLRICNQRHTMTDTRKELHQALVLCCNQNSNLSDKTNLKNLAEIFTNGAFKESNDCDTVRLSSARAAILLEGNDLSEQNLIKLRNTLLNLLYFRNDKESAEVLHIFALQLPEKYLPDLMTCLSAIKNQHSQRLLAQIHEHYQHLVVVAQNQDKLQLI